MTRYRMRRRKLEFQGSMPAGRCPCPVCGKKAYIHSYKAGEKWTTMICPQCGWWMVPTEYAPYGTVWSVVVVEIVEVTGRAAK